jgi:hypothetical protein
VPVGWRIQIGLPRRALGCHRCGALAIAFKFSIVDSPE